MTGVCVIDIGEKEERNGISRGDNIVQVNSEVNICMSCNSSMPCSTFGLN